MLFLFADVILLSDAFIGHSENFVRCAMKKTFKSLFASDRKVIGYFLSSNCAEIIEVSAAAGFDFVIIDNEHACWGIAPNIDLVRAADAAGIATLIRVPELTETLSLIHI